MEAALFGFFDLRAELSSPGGVGPSSPIGWLLIVLVPLGFLEDSSFLYTFLETF